MIFHFAPRAYVAGMIKALTLAALLALPALHAPAATQDDVLSATILPGWRTGAGSHMAALHLSLAPSWKTYWRSPGEAGIPPMFNWSGSDNLASVKIHWPRPTVFHLNGMQTIGYLTDLVLPLEITAIDPDKPIRLRATVDLGVCKDVCMPAALTLSADLQAPGAPDAAIKAALNARPETGDEAGLTQISCQVDPISDGLRVTATILMPATGGTETVVLEPGQEAVWVSETQSTREGRSLTATADFVPTSGAPFALDRSAMMVTVLGADRAVEILGCPSD